MLFRSRLNPSDRGELEITDLNRIYMEEGKLKVKLFDESIEWKDAGTFDSLLETSILVRDVRKNSGINMGCPEMIALEKGFVSKDDILKWIVEFKDNDYREYVEKLCK